MAVAVKNQAEGTLTRAGNALAVGSILGTAYVLGSLALLFYGGKYSQLAD